jgi:S-adenosylmethionine hydrolase
MLLYLLSDFGLSDTYVCQMKSAVLRKCGDSVQMVDLTHDVPRGSVHEAAWHLMVSGPTIPPGSVVVAVVDPGVGSGRRAVAVTDNEVVFVGPDNGIFSWLHPGRAFLLPESPVGISCTFHGRDLFAPAAAEILQNPRWSETLTEISIDSLEHIGKGCCIRHPAGLYTTVAHVDGFGNAVIWTKLEEMEGFSPSAVITPSGTRVKLTAVETYCRSPGADLLILQGSQGYMELAIGMGSAASVLTVSTGDALCIEGSFH